MRRLRLLLTLLLLAMAPAQADQTAARPSATAESQDIKPTIPFKQEAHGMGHDIGYSFSILIALLALAWGGLYASKKYLPLLRAKGMPGKRLHLLEVMRLTPRTTLFLVRFDEKTLLLGQHQDGVTVLDSIPDTSSPTRRQDV